MGVSILPSARTPWDVIGEKTGAALQDVLPGAIQQAQNRTMLQNSLDEIKKIASNPNSSPLDIQLAAMKAGAGIPGSEKYLGQLIPELVRFAEARRSQNTPQAGEVGTKAGMPRMHEPVEGMPQRPQLPGFLGQQQDTSQFFPTNVGVQGGPGNVPQAATTGVKSPLRTPKEMTQDAKTLASERTKSGIPTTPKEALEDIKADEEVKKLHNKAVDEELSQRREGQKTYGERAVSELRKVFPKDKPPTSEQETIFEKIGEEASKRGESEADINRYLAKEAIKFRNAMVNVEKDLSAPRLQNLIGRAINGTYKDFEKAGADLRSNLQPILDLGLYETARGLLEQKGYGPEEREMIINPLSEREKTIINQLPSAKPITKMTKMPGVPGIGQVSERQPIDLQNVKSALIDLKKVDPNFSLVLARKAFEDRGYDWRSFKDALNELESEGFKLEDDQRDQRGILDTPPLNKLEQILQGLNLIGR